MIPESHCSMLGAFNLKEGRTIAGFQVAFDAFCTHLKSEGYLKSWRLWERAYHEGYDANFPKLGVVLEMCFHNHQASLDGWEYIENDKGAIHRLHVDMNQQVKDATFVLLKEI